ncbi:MAG: DISARM system phospholipase D-like protein DrmC [Snowella sp.]|nr:DISARM system phospholipase D-like protein DrmC [Snowella sp.]
MSCFHQLSYPALLNLAKALENGRLTTPIYSFNLAPYTPSKVSSEVAIELEKLCSMGMTEAHIAHWLKLLAEERLASQHISDQIDLVWTGEELSGAECRDTSVVVKELFKSAQSSVLIASYAIDRGRKAQELFQVLATRLDNDPELHVRMFLNVQRPYKNGDSELLLLTKFAQTFKNEIWSGQRLPEVFYYPRSLSKETGPKACLHAKCVVVDEERLLITSANFTEAAHERNIEAGVLIADPITARSIRSQFETLVTKGIFRRVPEL